MEMIGKKFGKLTVLELNEKDERKGVYYFCKCDCGCEKSINKYNLIKGKSKACGYCRESPNKKHGLSNTRISSIYRGMKDRCFNPNNYDYKHYGGRGITICEEWLGENGFMNFVFWSNDNGYREDLTIDRIDNNKGYSPDNCRWATRREQANNTRRNTFYEHNGEVHTISEWSRISGVRPENIIHRIQSGWKFEDAISSAKRVNQYI